jgi:hypothetical protein
MDIFERFEYNHMNRFCSNVAIACFFYFVKTIYYFQTVVANFYNENEWFQYAVNITKYSLTKTINSINGITTEPFQKQWISINILVSENNQYKISQHFTDVNEMLLLWEPFNRDKSQNLFMKYEIIKTRIYHLCQTAKILFHYINSLKEVTVTVKKNDKYVSFVFFRENSIKYKFELTMAKSSVKFLSIRYKHPRLLNGIDIEIADNKYTENSAILSPLFVKKYLEEHGEPYIFDMHYSLEIIDNNINTFSLNSNQYIHLKKSDYDIVERNKRT